GLDVEDDLDLVGHDGGRELGRDLEVAAVDLGGGLDTDDLAALAHAVAEATQLGVQRHRLGDAVQGQLTVDDVAVALGANTGRAELERRELLDVEELLALDVGVALLVLGVDAVGLDGGVDRRVGEGLTGGDL